MTKSSVDRKRSRYGEKYTLRFHKPIKTYQLTWNETPMLLAKFVETDGDLAMRLWELLETQYQDIISLNFICDGLCKENEGLRQELNFIKASIDEVIKNSETKIENELREVIASYNEYMLGHKGSGKQ